MEKTGAQSTYGAGWFIVEGSTSTASSGQKTEVEPSGVKLLP